MKSISDPARGDEPRKHHPAIIFLHWLTLLCIVIAALIALLREIVEEPFWRQLLIETHQQVGLAVFACVILRLGFRLRFRAGNPMDGLPRLMRLAATITHWSLYALLLGLPLLGWATTNAHNLQLSFLGITQLPNLVGADSELADQILDWHILGAWALLDRKSTRLNSSHSDRSRMPSSA